MCRGCRDKRGDSTRDSACVGTGDQDWPARGHGRGLRPYEDRGPGMACAGTGPRTGPAWGQGPGTQPPAARCPPPPPARPLQAPEPQMSPAPSSGSCGGGSSPRAGPGGQRSGASWDVALKGPGRATRGGGRGVTSATAATAASRRCTSPIPGTDPVTRARDTGPGDVAGGRGRAAWPAPGAAAVRTRGFYDSRPGALARRGLSGGQMTLSSAQGAVCGLRV